MSHQTYPWFAMNEQAITVALKPWSEENGKIVEIDFVVDFNGFAQVMGFEIISLKYYAGPSILTDIHIDSLRSIGVGCSYIAETDVFYMRFPEDPVYRLVASGNVLDQKVLPGKIYLDRDGRASLFEVTLS